MRTTNRFLYFHDISLSLQDYILIEILKQVILMLILFLTDWKTRTPFDTWVIGHPSTFLFHHLQYWRGQRSKLQAWSSKNWIGFICGNDNCCSCSSTSLPWSGKAFLNYRFSRKKEYCRSWCGAYDSSNCSLYCTRKSWQRVWCQFGSLWQSALCEVFPRSDFFSSGLSHPPLPPLFMCVSLFLIFICGY